jgi:hypothetical protein
MAATSRQTADSWVDPVIEAYKPGVDRTLLVEALKMTPDERLVALQRLCESAEEVRRAGREARARS